MASELVFYTRSRCGLCDEALHRLQPMASLAGMTVRIADVAEASDASLVERVPVVGLPGGRELHAGPMSGWQAVWCVLRARVAPGGGDIGSAPVDR